MDLRKYQSAAVANLRASIGDGKKTPLLVGSRFGRLVVTGSGHSNNGKVWCCKCDCGTKNVTARAGHLRCGSTQSCGCLAKENQKYLQPGNNKTHGMSRHHLDTVFDNMLKRCYKPGSRRYEHYGGRGISICKHWLDDRSRFFEWALSNGYAKGLTIDRRDNDGNYHPDNCRFVTAIVQANNTSRNRFLTWKGETKTVAQWARKLGIRGQALQNRVTRGWSVDKIFTQPYRQWPNSNGEKK